MGAIRELSVAHGRLIQWALLGIIVITALILRLYRLPELTFFAGDAGRDSIVVQTMLTTGEPVLLGPSVSTGLYHRGPAYYYVLAPAFVLSGGDPIGGAAMTALADVVTVLLLGFFGAALGGWAVGLSAAALWATHAETIGLARFMWNPQFVPAFELLMLLALIGVARGQPRWLWVLGPAWVIAWQMHDQAVLLAPLLVVWWAAVRPKVPLSTYVIAFAFMAVALLPFLAYEFTNDFENVRAMIAQVVETPTVPSSAPNRAARLGEVASGLGRLLPQPPMIGVFLAGAAVVGFLFAVAKLRGLDRAGPLMVVLLALTTLLYAFWPTEVHFYYLYVVLLVPFLLVGLAVPALSRFHRPAGIALAAAIGAIAVAGAVTNYTVIRSEQPSSLALGSLKTLVGAIARDAAGQPFHAQLVSSYEHLGSYDAHYRYLLSYLVGPSPGRVDLPTYVIFDTPDSDVANRYDGSLVGGGKYALFTTPALGRELLQNSDFSSRGSPDQGWSLLDPNTTFDRDSSSDWVEIAGTDLEPPAPDGRNVVQAVEARGRQRYLVSFEYRSTGQPGDAKVFGQVLDSSGAAVATFPDGAGYLGSASGNWVVGSFYVDTGDASTIVIVLRNAGRHAVSFERVSLRPVISERVPGTPLR